MALKKQIDFKGITADYWKILRTSEDSLTNKTEVLIGLYKDAEARDLNVNNILLREIFHISGIDTDRAQVYEKLKLLEYFKEAEDI